MIFLPSSSIMDTLRQNPVPEVRKIMPAFFRGVPSGSGTHNGSAWVFTMEQWEYNLRDDIFSAFMMNNKKAATFLLQDLIEKSSHGHGGDLQYPL